jgi:hypothetical protein
MASVAPKNSIPTAASSPRKAPRTLPLFPGIGSWPSINRIVEDRSKQLMQQHGVTAWRDLGGEEGADGRLSFGASCGAARKLVAEVLHEYPGFILDTDPDATWAVRVARNARSSRHTNQNWYAHAIAYRGDVRLMDAAMRGRAASFIRRRLGELQRPGRKWTEDDRQLRVKLLRYGHRLQRASDGERSLRLLNRIAQLNGSDELEFPASVVAEAIWSKDRNTWPEGWFEAAATFLSSGAGYQIAVVQFGRHGWSPFIPSQFASVFSIQPSDGMEFRVKLPPLFDEILDTFVRAASPHQTN